MALMTEVFYTYAADLETPNGGFCLHSMPHIILTDPSHLSNWLSTFLHNRFII